MAFVGNFTRANRILAIFFDLDNTLIKTRNGDRLTCEKLIHILQSNYGISQEDAVVATQAFLRNFRRCPDNGCTPLEEWRVKLWTKALGDKYRSIATDVYKTWLNLRYQCLALTSDVKLMLKHLRLHYRLGLITNGPSQAQWEKIKYLGLSQYFDCILVSGDLPWEKPDRQIFLEGCKLLGVSPQNCLMVGDKLETDILGGIEAALGGTVWIPLTGDTPTHDVHELQPDFTIRNVSDLPKLLQYDQSNLPNVRRKPFQFSLPDLDDCSSNGSDGS